MSRAQAFNQRSGPGERSRVLIPVLGIAALGLMVASFAIGPANIPLSDLLARMVEGGNSPEALIAREIRLPRALLGALVGGILGLAGAALQGFLRNPLAEPGIIGVSAGAAFGAVVAIYFGFAAAFPMALPLMGMSGALIVAAIIYALAGRNASVLTLILAGLALNSFAGSLTALALNLAPSPRAALEIAFWLMGSLSDRSLQHLYLAAPFIVAGGLLILVNGRALDALSLGERTAASMGVNMRALSFRIVVGTAVAVGAAVSVSGAIAFIGLVVPHLIRPFVGHRPSQLLIASALAGAALLLAADIGVRLIPTYQELKLGVVTGLLGAPFFLVILLRTGRSTT